MSSSPQPDAPIARRGGGLPSRDLRIPPHAPGMRIGLFGGTFDPPHEAHLAASLLAMKRLGLDRVWWLVTPGNPLKDTRGLQPLAQAHRRRARADAPPAHRRHRSRSCHQDPLHLRHPRVSHPPLPGRAIRMDHGRRQPAKLLPLAELARDRGAACRWRWSTASVRASTRRARSPPRRSPAIASPKQAAPPVSPTASRRPGSTCTA